MWIQSDFTGSVVAKAQYEYAHPDAPTADEIASQKQAALRLIMDAFEEGEMDGLDIDCIVQAALFASLKEFVSIYGEEAVAKFAERLPERIRNGEFTLHRHG
jgi:hypothetical protein